MSQENAALKDETENSVSEELTSEIDAGVENIMTDISANEDVAGDGPTPDDAKDKDQDGKAPDDVKPDEIKPDDVKPEDVKPDEIKPDEIKPDEEPAPIPDELLTRAVKAGMSLADALDFQDAEALGRNLDLMDKTDKPKDGDVKPDEEIVDPLDAIPDFDPEEYDDKIVDGFKTMKNIIRNQRSEIEALNKRGQESSESLFDKKVDDLGEAYVKAVGKGKLDPNSPQAVKREALRNMYDILESGYKAKGQEISSSEVFEQAVGVILSAETRESALSVKSDKLEKRENQHTIRSEGKKTKVKMNALDEVAQELDDKYFKK